MGIIIDIDAKKLKNRIDNRHFLTFTLSWVLFFGIFMFIPNKFNVYYSVVETNYISTFRLYWIILGIIIGIIDNRKNIDTLFCMLTAPIVIIDALLLFLLTKIDPIKV